MRIKQQPLPTRKIQFEGVHKNDSLLIGNFGDVEFIAKGSFDLAGMIYCVRSSVTFRVVGDGCITFHGSCRRLVIDYVNGNCVLDFSKLECKEAVFITVKGKSEIILGPTKVVSRANIQDEAVLWYTNNPVFTNYSIAGAGRIEQLSRMVANAG